MGRFIIKITDEKDNKDYYLVWSTIVDAPITYGLSPEELREFYIEESEKRALKQLEEELIDVEKNGTSARWSTPESLYNCNRAGENETRLDKEGILENYCRNRRS